MPAPEAMLMMRPFFFSIMVGATAWEHRNVVLRFNSMTRSHSSSEMSVMGAKRKKPPAAFSRISTVLQRSSTFPTMLVTSCERVASTLSASALPPAPSISFATRSTSA